MSYHNILNNNANNFKLSVENNILYTKYNDINLFEYSVNSNISYKNIAAPSYLFLNSSSGIIYNNTNSNITINANKTIINCDVKINGKIEVESFVNNVVLVNQYNKIDWNYIPTIANTTTYNSLINVPADIINTTGRLGLGASNPSCICHINKNDFNYNIPVFSATTNSNIHVLDIFAEKGCVTINNSNGYLENSNIKLNVYGLTKTTQINVGNVFTVGENTEILNDLYVNNIKSRSNIIYIDSNTDLNINNFSLKTHTSNLNLINNCFKVQENKLLFNDNNLSFNFNNNKIVIKNSNNEFIINSNNILCDNLIVSNLTLINTQKFTSNPYIESVIDIHGKIKILSDSEYTVNNIYINNSNLFFTTINSNLFNYNIQNSSFLNISNNFNSDIFKSKYNNYGFYYNNSLNINNNSLIINETNIKDFTFNNNNLYYINSNGNIVSYDLILKTQQNINPIINIVKIDSYFNNYEYVYLNNNNELYYYNLNSVTNILSKINFNNGNLKIIDFSSGYNHTLVLFENNTLYSFGIDNYSLKKGFNNDTTNTITPILISNNNTIINKKIVKIKANWNNSIILDDNGLVYVFGVVNFNINFIIYNLINIPPIIDFCCNEYSVFLLSKYNDIYNYKYNNLTDSANALNTKINVFELPDYFYGTSIKSKGSIVIGGNNFNKLIPKNSLLVNNCVYIGSNINTYDKLITSNYSLIVSGDINIIGSIFNNGILFKGSSEGTFNSSGTYNWINQNNYNIYYNGNVGIGVSYPNKKLHVNGDAIFESNIYVNGNIITNEYKPWKTNNKSIYEYNKVGINIKNPDANFHLYDGNLKITGVNLLNNNYNLIQSNIQINSVSQNTYKNRIAISQNALTIVSTYYNSPYNNNNVNVIINKFINNTWNNYTFTKNNINDITNYGTSIAITKDGNTIFIGACNDSILNLTYGSLIYTGGIYVYNFDFTNNEFKYIKNLYYTVLSGINLTYIKIGKTICCSTDGNIIISDIYENVEKSPYYLLKKIINNDINNLLDFSYYQFYGSFNFINDNLILDCSFDSSIIVANFELNITNVGSYSNFIYYNFYIHYNNNIYFVRFNDNNANCKINSISISNDGDKIFITNVNGNYYLLNLNFNNILNSNYNQYNINYLNLEILYKGNSPTLTTNETVYRGKIAKSGNLFTLYSNKKIINYKIDVLNNILNSNITYINDINNLNDFNIDCDFNAYNYAVGYICNNYYNNTNNISITNNLLKIYNEVDIINANNLKVNINTDAYINKIYTNDIIGYGSNLSNIELSNIKNTNFIEGSILYSKNNKINQNSNLLWNESNSNLNINGYINCTSITGLFNLSNAVSILSLSNGGLGNNNFNENQILFASNSNITGNNNFKWVNNSNKLEINGDLLVNNISCCNISGNGYNISNLYAKNLTDIVSLSNGGLGINSINSNEILFGNNTNSIRTNQNFKWINDTNTLNINGNVYATDIFGSFHGSGAGLTSIPVGILNGVANVSNGGTGLTDIKYGLIPFGHYDNAINNTRLNTSPSFYYTGTDLYVNNYVFANKFSGNGEELSNIKASNITGKIGSNQGGIGDINIQYGNILVGSGYCNSVLVSTKLNLNDSNLILDGNFYGCNINADSFIGYGSNIKSLSASNIDGIINVKNGGTGLNTCLKDKFFVGNNQNAFNILSNLEWNFTDNLLKFNCNASLIINKPIILNNFLSNSHISEIINTSNGGTGNSNYDSNALIYYSQGKFIGNSNLTWNNDTSNFNLNGNINVNNNLIAKTFLGNGYLISNLNADSLSNVVSVAKGGTGNNSFISGNLLIGNGLSPLSSSSLLNWDYTINKLNILNGSIGVSNVYASNLYGNGENISNINVNKLNGIISLNNGGLGTNLIGSNELLIGYNSNAIKSDSNIKWISEQKQLLINGNISAYDINCSNLYGNGNNINNLNVNNLNGTITVNNGGTGKNNFNTGELLIGNGNSPVSSDSSLIWNSSTKLLNMQDEPP